MLHSVTFTFTQLGMVAFIASQVPEHLTASAQTIYDSLAIGLIFGVALYVVGRLSDIQFGWAFYAMAAMSVTAGLLALRGWRMDQQPG